MGEYGSGHDRDIPETALSSFNRYRFGRLRSLTIAFLEGAG